MSMAFSKGLSFIIIRSRRDFIVLTSLSLVYLTILESYLAKSEGVREIAIRNAIFRIRNLKEVHSNFLIRHQPRRTFDLAERIIIRSFSYIMQVTLTCHRNRSAKINTNFLANSVENLNR